MTQINTLHLPTNIENLPDGWSWSRLDEVCEGVYDCPHSTPILTQFGPFVVRSQDIRSGVFRTGAAGCVSEETYRTRTVKAEPRHGDLLYSREGTYFGIAAEVPPFTQVCLGQRMVLIRPKPDRVNFRYLRYWLNSPVLARHTHGFRDGSVAERLNLPTIRGLPIAVPPLRIQQRIAETLGSLDDKIEQNRRTGAALDRLARAIFRAWFVDFEPVRAKSAGERSFPGMSQPAFDSLPTQFTDSELGPIPQGWSVGRLGDCCTINARSVRKGEVQSEIEYVDISAVSVGKLSDVQRLPFDEAPSRARRRVQHGDTIWSCVRPNHRSYLFIHTPPANRIVSTGFAVLSPGEFGPSFLHQVTTQQEFVDYLVSNADGSAYPAVRPEHFASADVVVPDVVIRKAYESVTMPFRDLLAASEAESSKLAALRDYLLPKLLSGEVRVSHSAAPVVEGT